MRPATTIAVGLLLFVILLATVLQLFVFAN